MATIVTASNGGYNEHYNELQEGGSFPGFTRQAYYFSRMFQNVLQSYSRSVSNLAHYSKTEMPRFFLKLCTTC